MLVKIDADPHEVITKMSENRPFDSTASMCRIRVVVALDLLLHRDTIGRAISLLRPNWEVTLLSPDELADALSSSQPDAVISSNLIEPAGSTIPVWIILDSEGSAESAVILEGKQTEIGSSSLMSILGFIEHGYNSAKLRS
jgi:hypothetical protein